MDHEPIEVSPAAPRPKPCRACGADRPPHATYCDSCKSIHRSMQNREHQASYRGRILREAEEARRLEAAELERHQADDRARRRRAFLDRHGM